MRVLIVGAGALGGLIGATLTEAGEDVRLLEINLARVNLLNETGLFIARGTAGERCVPIRVVHSVADVGPVDLVFISVKSYQTESAIRGVQSVIGPETFVLSMQNGIGNTETIAQIIGPERVLGGITYHSVQHVGPNRLRYRPGIKPLQIAPFDGHLSPAVEAIAERFRRANLATDVMPSIETAVWQKLLHNATINPVSAMTGLTCQELLDDEAMQHFMRALCGEIVTVMNAKGITAPNPEDPYLPLLESQAALGKNRPSMWQDLARGVRTEIDAINGAVVREANRLGIDAPYNWGIVQFVHSREHQKILRKQQHDHVLRQMRQRTRPIVRSTGIDPAGGMPSGRVPLECAGKLREIVREYYRDLQAADRDPNRHVAWIAGTGPVELLRAFGFDLYFPENHSALIGSTRLAGQYITRALAEGFSPFASSGMTSDIGAMLAGESPLVKAHGIDGPPRPELLVYDTNFGHSLARWFEYYGNRFDVPVMGIHSPRGLTELETVEVEYGVQQLLRLSKQLETHTASTLDPAHLAAVVEFSNRAAELWGQILSLARTTPSPLTMFDLLVHMAPIVMMRGLPQAVEYYEILLAELEDRVANQQAAVPGERFRFYWEGPPIWCGLRALASLFLKHRVAVVGASYTQMFAFAGLDPTNPIESMARAYIGIFANRSDAAKAQTLTAQFKTFGVDAVVFHDDRTGPELSNVRYGLAKRLQTTTGLPALIIEADSHDPRLFSLDALQAQLANFVEVANVPDATSTGTSGSVTMNTSTTAGIDTKGPLA